MLTGRPSSVAKRLAPEVSAPDGEVVVPATLSPEGRVVWDRLAPIAIAMRTLTPADCEAFKNLCELQATLDHVSVAKAAPGYSPIVVTENSDGYVQTAIHAVTRLELQATAAIRPYFERFGLDPSSRSRFSIATAKPASKWGALAT